MKNILIIRLGALGDLVFCFQAFAAIRRAHPHARIALLTRAPFADFAQTMPWFDQVIIDPHANTRQIGPWFELIQTIRTFAPDRVYDLQGKTRQTYLYALLGGPIGPTWSGAAPFCRYPRLWPPEKNMSFVGFLAAQLQRAGIDPVITPDLAWLDAPTDRFNLPDQYILLIPGCTPHAHFKRWPPESYANLANNFYERGIASVIIGTRDDAPVITAIHTAAPHSINLCGQTTLHQVAGLARRAVGVIGNDTGPLHLAAAVGAPTLALFSGRSNLIWSTPPGPRVTVLQQDILAELSTARVMTAFDGLLQNSKSKG